MLSCIPTEAPAVVAAGAPEPLIDYALLMKLELLNKGVLLAELLSFFICYLQSS